MLLLLLFSWGFYPNDCCISFSLSRDVYCPFNFRFYLIVSPHSSRTNLVSRSSSFPSSSFSLPRIFVLPASSVPFITLSSQTCKSLLSSFSYSAHSLLSIKTFFPESFCNKLYFTSSICFFSIDSWGNIISLEISKSSFRRLTTQLSFFGSDSYSSLLISESFESVLHSSLSSIIISSKSESAESMIFTWHIFYDSYTLWTSSRLFSFIFTSCFSIILASSFILQKLSVFSIFSLKLTSWLWSTWLALTIFTFGSTSFLESSSIL